MNKTVLAVILAALALSACNTFQGMGRDIEGAGEAISGSAVKTKEQITK